MENDQLFYVLLMRRCIVNDSGVQGFKTEYNLQVSFIYGPYIQLGMKAQ